MKTHRAYKVELDPNNVQRTMLRQHAGAARFVWNWGLERRIDEYEKTKKSSTAIAQHKQLVELKNSGQLAWLSEVSKWAPQEALRDLDEAYKNFYRRVKKGEKPGFPKFKKRKEGHGSFRTYRATVSHGHIRLEKIGWIKLKEAGYIPTTQAGEATASVSERNGRWYVSVLFEQEVNPRKATGEAIGIDLGIKELAVVSDGRRFQNPNPLKAAQAKVSRLQRKLARQKRGGKNRSKTVRRLARAHERVSNIRKDVLHKTTSAIVAKSKPDYARPSVIVIEDLKVSGMMKNHKLARAIGDVGMAEFRRQIEYKSVWAGVEVLVADRFFPSSKTCSVCGAINHSLKLSDRKWTCSCGVVHDRDMNAAINLRNCSTVSRTGIDAYGQDVRPASAGRLDEVGTKPYAAMSAFGKS